MNKEFQITNEEKTAIVNYLSGELTTNDTEILNRWWKKAKPTN